MKITLYCPIFYNFHSDSLEDKIIYEEVTSEINTTFTFLSYTPCDFKDDEETNITIEYLHALSDNFSNIYFTKVKILHMSVF